MYSPYLSPFIAGFVKTIEWKSPIIQLHIITMKPLTYGEVLTGLHPIFMPSGRKEGSHVEKILLAVLSCAILIIREIFNDDGQDL